VQNKVMEGWYDVDASELFSLGVFTSANFGENRSRNVTVRVHTGGHTDTLMHRHKPVLSQCPLTYIPSFVQIHSGLGVITKLPTTPKVITI